MCFRKRVETAIPDLTVVQTLDEFWPLFVNSRSLSVYLPKEGIGATVFRPGPFYQASTPYDLISLKTPLDGQIRDAHNRIATWTNENCLIRLWAILESNGYTKPIREKARRSEAVKLLKQLRQHFAHGSGRYDDSNPDHRSLRRKVLKQFPVPDDPPDIPLNIDLVLEPMFLACKEYVKDVLIREGRSI
jgi:hypothetical protein